MDEILLGLSLGWAAGISPGPLTALIVTTSLRKGFAGGARVAVAPLITDLPVIVATVLVLTRVPDGVLRGLGLAGGAYLVWLGAQELRAFGRGPIDVEAPAGAADVRRGALTNLLNPQMWLFWVTVGAPIVAGADSGMRAGAFLGSFYLLLIGTKLTLAWLVGRSRSRMIDQGWAARTVGAGGVALMALGVVVAVRAW
jgi:threonine/homoserine/homoserine lactone efflux protein